MPIDQILNQGDETLLGYHFLFVMHRINDPEISSDDSISYATIREKLMSFLIDQTITSVDTLKTQTTYLNQITEREEQLTRSTLVREALIDDIQLLCSFRF